MLGDKRSWRWHVVLITDTFTQIIIILKWIGLSSYLSDLKLTSHHTCYASPNPTLQEMLLVKGWLIGRWTKRKQTNKKQNNWLFTEVGKVAQEQFKWGFPNASDS